LAQARYVNPASGIFAFTKKKSSSTTLLIPEGVTSIYRISTNGTLPTPVESIAEEMECEDIRFSFAGKKLFLHGSCHSFSALVITVLGISFSWEGPE
jgi:hypothetical protein